MPSGGTDLKIFLRIDSFNFVHVGRYHSDSENHLFGHGVLENLIQALSRTFRQIKGLSRTMSVFKDFPGLENLEKKIKDFQGPARALH